MQTVLKHAIFGIMHQSHMSILSSLPDYGFIQESFSHSGFVTKLVIQGEKFY